MTGPSQWRKAVVPKHFTVPYPLFFVFVAAATPPPPHTYSSYNTCQCNFFAEYGFTSVFWAVRLGYSDINKSTGPGIFIKIKKVNGELINIGSCCGHPAMPLRTTRGPRTSG